MAQYATIECIRMQHNEIMLIDTHVNLLALNFIYSILKLSS